MHISGLFRIVICHYTGVYCKGNIPDFCYKQEDVKCYYDLGNQYVNVTHADVIFKCLCDILSSVTGFHAYSRYIIYLFCSIDFIK